MDQEYDEVLDVMLTTYDNPYNPFTQWDEWYKYDTDNDYNTPELLAFVMATDDDLLDTEEELGLQAAAMNWIVDNGPIENVWCLCKPTTKTPIRQPTEIK